jgi:hypothetical protein
MGVSNDVDAMRTARDTGWNVLFNSNMSGYTRVVCKCCMWRVEDDVQTKTDT